MANKAYLCLENGKVFEGYSFGAQGETIGEVVFTTSMTGYLETLTDPAFFGQIVVQTFPLIGNYGVIPEDFESNKPHLKAYVVKECCQEPSNFRCSGVLDNFLKENNIIGIYGIDTRALTRLVREHGTMNAIISTDKQAALNKLEQVKSYKIQKPVLQVADHEPYVVGEKNNGLKVSVYDLGAKKSLAEALVRRGCKVTVYGCNATAEQMLESCPDGILISNGPGNPKDNGFQIEQLKSLAKKRIPMFGICLGHQLLALSQGADCVEMAHSHMGENQPVIDKESDRVYITSQGHGFAVDMNKLPKGASVSFVNVNDGTCEGLTYKNIPAFSVQFNPEGCGGPLDTVFMFDKFVELMQEVDFNAVK